MPGESVDAYNSRIAALRGDATASQPAATDTTSSIIDALSKRVLGDNGMVTSDTTSIDSALSDLRASNDATKAGIVATYNKNRQSLIQSGQQNVTSFQEASRGFAVNSAVLRQLNDETSKALGDLNTQEQIALSNADAATASKVADMKVQLMQFRNDTMQRQFTNALSQ